MAHYKPVYITAFESGLLQQNIEESFLILESCTLCPRNCKVDRTSGQTGTCKTADRAVVASYAPHFGEEAPLVGSNGSGTIFFTHCNLLCNFCQNYDISHEGVGQEVSKSTLARIMLDIQQRGCHNINLVTPSHVIPQILAALEIAINHGLAIPLVYNCGGYESVEALMLLDGIVDIYMPDFKFWDSKVADETCGAPDYPEKAKAGLKEMFRQVGDLKTENGIANRGLLVRHLVMPDGLAGTEQVMRFIADEISKNTFINIMPQYRPCGQAFDFLSLARGITPEEFDCAIAIAKKSGLWRFAE